MLLVERSEYSAQTQLSDCDKRITWYFPTIDAKISKNA